MTLETGKHSKRGQRCAFTLIELVLVMTLLVVAVSLVAPRMSDFVRGRALDSEARRMVALVDAGQARAVSEGMPVVLWFDQKQNKCGLEEESPPQGGDKKAEDVDISDSVRIGTIAVATGTGASSTGMTTFNHLPAIRFLPDGTVDENSPQSVELTQGSESVVLKELQNKTGYEINGSQN
jgi:prepilin-type N-terminal cleavage/methylation domain-containing protein